MARGGREWLERQLAVVVAELRWLSANASRLAIDELGTCIRCSLLRQRAVLPFLDRHADSLAPDALLTFRACQRDILAHARRRLAAAARARVPPHLN